MGDYKVELRLSAQKNLNLLSEQEYKIIIKVLLSLEHDPRPAKVKKLNSPRRIQLWRIRVGRSRIVYTIDDKLNLVTILRVAKRRENTYKGLL